jgi:hypothetical protein
MGGEFEVWRFRKLAPVEFETEPKNYFVLHVKWPLLLIDGKQSWKLRGMEFQKHLSNGGRDKAEKVPGSSSALNY